LYNAAVVDEHLPFCERDARPLRSLFLDLNSYFASVEQQERPELRGRPIAVVPVMADSSCAIAASYEAKRFGISTGTLIGEAKTLCPGIVLVESQPKLYVDYHRKVLEAVDEVLPVEEVCSIDEMRFALIGAEREPDKARRLATRLKAAIRNRVGQCLTCSIGVAPNPFLAKIATELQKPDGLVVIEAGELPKRLEELPLRGFTGINRRMEVRLNAAGIFDARDLCSADADHLRRAFGSVVGERWWYLLRGYDLPSKDTRRRSLGHSHVLPPDKRSEAGCREVMLRLIQKAALRLREKGLYARSMDVSVRGFTKSWTAHVRIPASHDTLTLTERFLEVWEGRDFVRPRAVGVSFTDLQETEQVTPSLFDPVEERGRLEGAVDEINRKFGRNTVFLGGMSGARSDAPGRIAFGKSFEETEGEME
jgi:DNA polymerase IV